MPITWRNVNVDGAVGEGIRNYREAAKGLSTGIGDIGDTALKYDQAVVDAQTNAAMAQVAGYQNADQLNAERGNFMQNLGRADAAKVAGALNKRESSILANDGTRISNEAGRTELNYLEPKLQQEADGRILGNAKTAADTAHIGWDEKFQVGKQETADNQWVETMNFDKVQHGDDMLYKYMSLDETNRANKANESLSKQQLSLQKKRYQADQKARRAAAANAAKDAASNREQAVFITNSLSGIHNEETAAAAYQSIASKYGVAVAEKSIKNWSRTHSELRKSGLLDKDKGTSYANIVTSHLNVDPKLLTGKDSIHIGNFVSAVKGIIKNGVAVAGSSTKFVPKNQAQKDALAKFAVDNGGLTTKGFMDFGSDNIVAKKSTVQNMRLTQGQYNALKSLENIGK